MLRRIACDLQGSMLYFVRGYFPILSAHLAPRTFRLCNAIGFGVGSLILMTGGYLLILKMIVREDDPELELHQRLQGGDEEAMNGKLLAMAEVGLPASDETCHASCSAYCPLTVCMWARHSRHI